MELTDREIELIDGMIEAQLDHANRCDTIANRVMAEKQKGWDMERVALLEKIKNTRATDPRLDEMARLLTRYLKETPLGHQPHMIAHKVEEVLEKYREATCQQEKK